MLAVTRLQPLEGTSNMLYLLTSFEAGGPMSAHWRCVRDGAQSAIAQLKGIGTLHAHTSSCQSVLSSTVRQAEKSSVMSRVRAAPVLCHHLSPGSGILFPKPCAVNSFHMTAHGQGMYCLLSSNASFRRRFVRPSRDGLVLGIEGWEKRVMAGRPCDVG